MTWYWSTSPTPTLAGIEPLNVAVVPEMVTVRLSTLRLLALVPTLR